MVVEFDDEGNITEHIILDSHIGNYGAEITPRIWHTIICLEASSVAYEVKDGPYDASVDKNFAPWAPTEGDDNCTAYLTEIIEKLDLK